MKYYIIFNNQYSIMYILNLEVTDLITISLQIKYLFNCNKCCNINLCKVL